MYNNNLVFKKMEEDKFLFNSDKGHWMIGTQPIGSQGYLFQEEQGGLLPLTEGDWSFWTGDKWLPGQVILVVPGDDHTAQVDFVENSNKVQVIVKQFPDYEESMEESYVSNIIEPTEDNDEDRAKANENKVTDEYLADISQSVSQADEKELSIVDNTTVESGAETFNLNCKSDNVFRKVMKVLDGFGDLTTIMQELRYLEKKISKLESTMKLLGSEAALHENDKSKIKKHNLRSILSINRYYQEPTEIPVYKSPLKYSSTNKRENMSNDYVKKYLGSAKEHGCPNNDSWIALAEGCYKFYSEQ